MTTLDITHDHRDGSLLTGSTKADAGAIKATGQGWRWSSNLGCWYLPNSRDRIASHKVEATARLLRAAGYEVTVTVDNVPRDMAEVVADRIERSEDRREALEVKAADRMATADATLTRARQMADAIPMGQPMLTDHHSYKRDRNYRDRMVATTRRGFEQLAEAKATESRAAAVTNHDRRLSDPGYLGRKIETVGAELRKVTRSIEGEPGWLPDGSFGVVKATGDYLERCQDRRTQLAGEMDYYTARLTEVQTQAEAAGKVVPSKATVKVGDLVKFSYGRWAKVARVSAKTVSVETGYSWTDRVPYTEITEVRSGAGAGAGAGASAPA